MNMRNLQILAIDPLLMLLFPIVIPELRYWPAGEDRRAAVREALRLTGQLGVPMPVAGSMAVIFFAPSLVAMAAGRGLVDVGLVGFIAVGLASLMFPCCIMWIALRPRLQAVLRLMSRERGLRLCLNCGYPEGAITGEPCSECGIVDADRAVKKLLLRPYYDIVKSADADKAVRVVVMAQAAAGLWYSHRLLLVIAIMVLIVPMSIALERQTNAGTWMLVPAAGAMVCTPFAVYSLVRRRVRRELRRLSGCSFVASEVGQDKREVSHSESRPPMPPR